MKTRVWQISEEKRGINMQKKVTLSFDEKIYEKFKKFCSDNAIMLSKRLELEMQKIMDMEKGGKNE